MLRYSRRLWCTLPAVDTEEKGGLFACTPTLRVIIGIMLQCKVMCMIAALRMLPEISSGTPGRLALHHAPACEVDVHSPWQRCWLQAALPSIPSPDSLHRVRARCIVEFHPKVHDMSSSAH